MTAWYSHHVFFCTNLRDDPARPCCAARGAEPLRAYAKQRVKELGLAGVGGVRINMAGCMDRCGQGPVMVVYPQGVWYTFASEDDIDEIIREHLVGGAVVERLLLPAPRGRR